ncbi:MAG TPA: hypothetical protein DCE55_27840, partial [Planctomycetaceae bacterium]|nr:hypothetical protein [Planctomycetaceae bacterium]
GGFAEGFRQAVTRTSSHGIELTMPWSRIVAQPVTTPESRHQLGGKSANCNRHISARFRSPNSPYSSIKRCTQQGHSSDFNSVGVA